MFRGRIELRVVRPDHGQLCQVFEAHALWGGTSCCNWLPWRKRKRKRKRNTNCLKSRRIEAVRAGFKKAWQEKSEAGYSTIIEMAKKIPDIVLQEDPKLLMWYDQAVTRMGGE